QRAGGDSGGDGHHRAACPRGRLHLLRRGPAVHGQALLQRSHLHPTADLPVTRASIAMELAGALRGTFRAQLPSPAPVSPELLASARVSGVEALLARRMGAPDRATERYQILEQALRERRLAGLLAALEAHRIRAATFKGWALSRLYPVGLRPVGDVDLAVHPDDEGHARAVLAALPAAERLEVDLQANLIRYLPDRSLDELLDRRVVHPSASGPISVLGAEDHLRLVCLHQLHHGAWRPLWLCDVAGLLRALPPGLSWAPGPAGGRPGRRAGRRCAGARGGRGG